MGFFDAYPQFVGKGIRAGRSRLNLRHAAIIGWNASILAGARVLDLASYNGRWTLAALKAGASHAHGVEENPAYVQEAATLLPGAGLDPASFQLTIANVYDFLPTVQPGSVDVVMALGFLYHFGHHVWFFEQLQRIAAKAVILDTKVSLLRGNVIGYSVETPEQFGPLRSCVQETRVRGFPSKGFLQMAFRQAGYTTVSYRWQPRTIRIYTAGERVTMRATRIAI